MTQTLMFKNGDTLSILNESVLIPSGSVFVRNKFSVHVTDGDFTSFLTAFSNTENLGEMLFTGLNDDGEVMFQHHLYNYNIVSDIGRKLIETTNTETGAVTKVYHLVAMLEQPTKSEGGGSDPEADEIVDILLGRE